MIYPINRYARLELSGGMMQLQASATTIRPAGSRPATTSSRSTAQSLFANGNLMPLGARLRPRDDGVPRVRPARRATRCALGYEYSPKLGDSFISRQTVDVDARKYMRLATNGVLAFRFRGLQELGRLPDVPLLRRQLRDARLRLPRSSSATSAFFANAELRFPLIEATLTPFGVLGGLRAVAFANIGGAQIAQPCRSTSLRTTTRAGRADHSATRRTSSPAPITPVYGPPYVVNGLRLVDGRASYGIGLETFALGFPIHFDWAWRTLLNKRWEDYVYSYQASLDGYSSGSTWLRKPKFCFWIGYDF